MPKQRLEGDFKEFASYNTNLYILKLQVEKRSFTGMPADFLVLSDNYKYMVECKENKSSSYPFSRSSQVKKLQTFELKSTNNTNVAYFLISFWLGSVKKSLYYLIPLKEYLKFEGLTGKKSGNIHDFNLHLSEYEIDLPLISQYFI